LSYYTMHERQRPSAGFEWRRLQVTISRDDGEDVCVNTFDVINITSGAVDTTWTTTDYTTAEARFTTFYNAIKSYLGSTAHTLTYRWYVSPRIPGDARPPARITTAVSDLAPGFDPLPNQVAMSLTKITA